ncbi:sugar nucleotide-binding protein [Microbacterium sp. SD291]|uniref:sugar nucleotide-binding protein n=1 Tax=Microbacterium sp. SD291 TaxID=2782007 RepID=UPI001A97C58D|nr:sugar nucleotide-binding protein [Microbacterium sp. SD291]MBO0979683.1 sugar nucleotide-binding protein [Microbacterium sp. SD291]
MTLADIWGAGGRAPGRTLLVGCGKLGIGLGRRLVAGGCEVVAIRRDPDGLPDEFEAIGADLRLPLAQKLPECDSVVITVPPDAAATAHHSVYVDVLINLADALPSRPGRVVFVSSTRVFEGRPGPQPLTEKDAPAPSGARSIELLAGESTAERLFDACIVRPAGIYGPGRDSLIRRVAEGAPVDGSRRTNRIHETDLVSLLEAMLRAESPPTLIHAVDQEPAPLGDVVSHIASRLGVAPPPPAVSESGGGTVLDGSLLAGFLGSLRYPTYREGYDGMLEARAAADGSRRPA